MDVFLQVLVLNRGSGANFPCKLNPQIKNGRWSDWLRRTENLSKLVQQSPLVNFKDEMFVELDFAKKFKDVLSVKVHFK